MVSKRMYIAATIMIIIIGGSLAVWWYDSQLKVEYKLVIIHSQNADFANYVINDFEEWFMDTKGFEINVSQLTPGDSGIVLGQVFAWEGRPEADIFWGGDVYNFGEAANESLLYPYTTVNDAVIVEEFNSGL